jgi:hypothetical protein
MRIFTADLENEFEEAVNELVAQAKQTAEALAANKRELGLAGMPGFVMDEVRLREKALAVKDAMKALRRARHGIPATTEAR